MSITTIEQNLIDTMMGENALGLAANQIGIPYRVFAIHIQQNGQILVMFNPEIVSTSTETWMAPEGCLSFPNIELMISRPKTVVGAWHDAQGDYHEREFREIDAKCFLHELDHLNGRIFKDLVSDLKFQRAKAKAQKR